MPVIDENGIVKVKIISPGSGSSGYYSPEVLEKAAPKFADAQCYWNHPSLTEDRERPERSLRDLAAKVQGEPAWEPKGPTGPGVYADVKVFKPYRESVEELAPHIGMSIRALGKAKRGEADGKKQSVIESIDKVKSVDFVTPAWTRGRDTISIRGSEGKALDTDTEGEVADTEEAKRMAEELKELTEVKGKLSELEEAKKTTDEENARLKEAAILREAHDLAADKVGASWLPEITRTRLIETLAAKPVLKEGALDIEETGKQIDEAIKAEGDYIAKLTGSGRIQGMGASDSGSSTSKLKESFKAGFLREGITEEKAEKMAEIAVRGR